jgi:hypothetical protein
MSSRGGAEDEGGDDGGGNAGFGGEENAMAEAAVSVGAGQEMEPGESSAIPSDEKRAEAALRALSHHTGVSPSQRDCVAWMHALLADDGMVDAFAALRPAARARFTCWDQYRNQRYANCGRRIDYFLVDHEIFALARAGGPLVEDETEAGALQAATAGGRWRPAPTHGVLSGLQEAPQTTHDTQFARVPHTGILYTAPQASDHVAVTLLLDADAALARPVTATATASDAAARAPRTTTLDAATKACSFRPQASLKSFFAPAASSKRPAEGDAAAATGAGSSSRSVKNKL